QKSEVRNQKQEKAIGMVKMQEDLKVCRTYVRIKSAKVPISASGRPVSLPLCGVATGLASDIRHPRLRK
ncbi:MAG: hypothetical protein ABIG11_06145, partial [bacterium]